MFDPTAHMTDLRGADYLEVKWRIVWFREREPNGAIVTELIDGGDPVMVKAYVQDADGNVVSTGLAEHPRKGQFGDKAVMKCETAAIGRALAHAGYGTQFAGEDMEEGVLADSPVTPHNGSGGGVPSPGTDAPAAVPHYSGDIAACESVADVEWILGQRLNRDILAGVVDRPHAINALVMAAKRWIEVSQSIAEVNSLKTWLAREWASGAYEPIPPIAKLPQGAEVIALAAKAKKTLASSMADEDHEWGGEEQGALV